MKFPQILLALAVTGVASAAAPESVPEIDGSAAVSAIALVTGAVIVLKARRSK